LREWVHEYDANARAIRAPGEQPATPKHAYLEAVTQIERLHRQLLDVIKDELDRTGQGEINSVQALLLYNIGDAELTAGEFAHAWPLSGLQRLL